MPGELPARKCTKHLKEGTTYQAAGAGTSTPAGFAARALRAPLRAAPLALATWWCGCWHDAPRHEAVGGSQDVCNRFAPAFVEKEERPESPMCP